MNRSQWKTLSEDLTRGVERELRASAPSKARIALREFRSRAKRCRLKRERRRFDRELEAFLQSTPYLRAATKRHLRRIAIPILKRTVRVLKRVVRVYKTIAKNQNPSARAPLTRAERLLGRAERLLARAWDRINK